MNSFNFGRPVEIEGEVYYINSDFSGAKDALEETRNVLADKSATREDQKNAYGKSLDIILGEGAFEKIFKSRAFNYADAAGLVIFLTKEINEWRNELQ